jgi:hypothetical protein
MPATLRIGLLLALLPCLALAAPQTTYTAPAADSTARAAAVAAQAGANNVLRADVTVGAEAANKINLSVITVDRDGAPWAVTTEYLVQVLTVDGLAALDTVATLEEIGVGSHISGDVEPVVILATDANGQMAVQVADVAGASGATFYVILTPMYSSTNTGTLAGLPVRVTVTFDGA